MNSYLVASAFWEKLGLNIFDLEQCDATWVRTMSIIIGAENKAQSGAMEDIEKRRRQTKGKQRG